MPFLFRAHQFFEHLHGLKMLFVDFAAWSMRIVRVLFGKKPLNFRIITPHCLVESRYVYYHKFKIKTSSFKRKLVLEYNSELKSYRGMVTILVNCLFFFTVLKFNSASSQHKFGCHFWSYYRNKELAILHYVNKAQVMFLFTF